jgi:hypothetical protein
MIRPRPIYDHAMALEVDAINPVRYEWMPANLGIVARWEATCGFCRLRFSRLAWDLPVGTRLSWVGCPACGTRNLLPQHPRYRAGRG